MLVVEMVILEDDDGRKKGEKQSLGWEIAMGRHKDL